MEPNMTTDVQLLQSPVASIFLFQLGWGEEPTIRHLVTPIHNHTGELMRNRMTKKLDEEQATEEVRRAINAWLYAEPEPSHSQSPAPAHTFGECVSRILLAYHIGQASLRGYFGSPESFNRMEGQTRKAIEAAYRALWNSHSL